MLQKKRLVTENTLIVLLFEQAQFLRKVEKSINKEAGKRSKDINRYRKYKIHLNKHIGKISVITNLIN